MSIKDKLMEKGEKAIIKAVDKTLGKIPTEKQAAFLAKSLRKMIPLIGVTEMSKRVITGIEGDFRKKLEGNPDLTIDELISEYIKEPESMVLLKDLKMGEEHLRVMAKNVIADRVKLGKRG